jgi:CRP/FNR family transcriptional regulator, cyclic AMP receptor protein
MQRRFAAGEVLLREGDPSDEVVLIEAGRAEVLRAAGDGSILLGTVGPGEFIGEMGVLEGRPRSATVRAAS